MKEIAPEIQDAITEIVNIGFGPAANLLPL
jgi:hypothetical protein